MAGLLAMGSLSAVLGRAEHARILNLLDGEGWLSESSQGTIMQANGATGRVVLAIQVKGDAGDDLKVLQSGKTTILDDVTKSALSRVNTSTFAVSDPTQVSPNSTPIITPTAVYVVNNAAGTVEVQSRSLKVLGTFGVGSRLSTPVVDSTGRMWTVDSATGIIIAAEVDHGHLIRENGGRVVPSGTPANQVELTLVDGNLAVLDLANRTFTEAPDGVPSRPIAVDVPSGATDATVHIPATTNGDAVPVAVEGAGIGVINVASSQYVPTSLPTTISPSDSLGQPQAYEGRFYVPDLSSGDVVVLKQESSGLVVAGPSIQVSGPSSAVQVSAQGGYLWIDNPAGSQSVVVHPNGSTQIIDKSQPNVLTNAAPPPTTTTLAPVVPPSTTTTTVPPTGITGATGATPTSLVPVAHQPGHNGRSATSTTDTTLVPTSTTSTTTTTTTTTTAPPAAPQAPSAPTEVDVVGGDDSVTVDWSGALDNGSPITGYTVAWTATGPLGTSGSENVTSSPLTVLGLTNGATYQFSVLATNSVGSSPATQASTTVSPSRNVPDAPTGVTATAGTDGSITVNWMAAGGEGHLISSYLVSIDNVTSGATTTTTAAPGSTTLPSNTSANTVTVQAPLTTTTLDASDGLVLGDQYTFTVVAVNDTGGESAPSAATAAVTAHTPAEAVADLVASGSANNGTIAVSWTCGPSDATCSGGSDITKFEIKVSPTPSSSPSVPGVVSGQSGYSTTVQGLTDGTPYTVSVLACNVLGCTPTADVPTATATPVQPPAEPGITSASVNGTSITWTWSLSASGYGSASLSSYTVTVNGGVVQTGLSTSYTGNYGYGSGETISITATNSAGLTGPPAQNQQTTVTTTTTTTTTTPPPPPSVSISLSTDTACSGCYWIDVSASNFPANAAVTFACYDNGPTGQPFYTNSTWYKTNSSGSVSWSGSGSSAEACYDSTYTAYVVITAGGESATSSSVKT